MDTLKKKWDELVDKNPKLAQWIREGGLFFLVSNLITIVRALPFVRIARLLLSEMLWEMWTDIEDV